MDTYLGFPFVSKNTETVPVYEYAIVAEDAVRRYLKKNYPEKANEYSKLLQKKWVGFTLNAYGCLTSIFYEWYDKITVTAYGIRYESEHGRIEQICVFRDGFNDLFVD